MAALFSTTESSVGGYSEAIRNQEFRSYRSSGVTEFESHAVGGEYFR
jgi:hypothetical protein